MGLSKLSRLTTNGPVQMHVYLETFDATDNWAYALYDSFQITDSTDNYRLILSGYSGTAGDGMGETGQTANNMPFTTRDRDNDMYTNRFAEDNCAIRTKGAWWYNSCHDANLNGLYLGGVHTSYGDGINWVPYAGDYYSPQSTRRRPHLRRSANMNE